MTSTSLYLRNLVEYIHEFGVPCAISLVWQRKLRVVLMKLRPRGIRYALACRSNSSDFAVLRQVIGKREVAFPLRASPRTIIDAGANVGYASIVFANFWPSAKIVAIEPDPVNYQLLIENTKNYDNIKCLHGALWPIDADLQIANPNDASFEFRVTPANGSEKPIHGFTIRRIQEISGFSMIDLLKLDIEGSEYELLSHNPQGWLGNIGTVAVELHDRFKPGCTEIANAAMAGWLHSKFGEYDLYCRP